MIPESLKPTLARKLTEAILNSGEDVPAEQARRIITLWRTDSLATDEGIEALTEAAKTVSPGVLGLISHELNIPAIYQ